ncbi:5-formyltetrahydrofolate cyclo-ligase [Commensalibacter oyaizuii]|uniref:5-formyltetrahydrofolate cyclo-ligase n=1 Tax=Commensalibacter oyaizuii TaxID=3043873 RepID=A0ABT6PYH5_9PROT|nr:5-formyltetrahydrofolate cyclo-ligase [Commensalibacter sp. TBRC 16381]MDI2089903.1 5-formyltetrahydrofolate cyclo-ligase [Commensalibacter sp. TBRC 16381]
MGDTIQIKEQLRCKMQQLRSQKYSFHVDHTVFLLQNMFKLVTSTCKQGDVVACFWPLEGEADLRPLVNQLFHQGYKIALPKTPPKGLPLCFYTWYPDASMVVGRYKTIYPDTSVVAPDFIFVPLLAFDLFGNRLGYGGGYYDRTLQCFPNAKVAGVAFSYQEVPCVPTEMYDYKLPIIVTEAKIIHIKKG